MKAWLRDYVSAKKRSSQQNRYTARIPSTLMPQGRKYITTVTYLLHATAPGGDGTPAYEQLHSYRGTPAASKYSTSYTQRRWMAGWAFLGSSALTLIGRNNTEHIMMSLTLSCQWRPSLVMDTFIQCTLSALSSCTKVLVQTIILLKHI